MKSTNSILNQFLHSLQKWIPIFIGHQISFSLKEMQTYAVGQPAFLISAAVKKFNSK